MNGHATLYLVICTGNGGNPIRWDCSSAAQAHRVIRTLRDTGIAGPIRIVIA